MITALVIVAVAGISMMIGNTIGSRMTVKSMLENHDVYPSD